MEIDKKDIPQLKKIIREAITANLESIHSCINDEKYEEAAELLLIVNKDKKFKDKYFPDLSITY